MQTAVFPTLVIAEAGVNHNGSLDLALQLVDAAAEAGADVVKFQTFRAAALASVSAPKAAYQARQTGGGESQLEMLKRLELPYEAHQVLMDRCRERSIQFLSSPFDPESVAFLAETLRLPTLKLGSGEVTNAPLLLDVARRGKALILSTGMATLGEVEAALGVLAFGYLGWPDEPGQAAFSAAYADPAAAAVLQQKVSLLHCTTEYPAPVGDVNLRAMDTLAAAFGVPVGFSDHTEGGVIAAAAVARGARIIEKHLTLDRSMAGPDHKASLDPAGFAAMVAGIRQVEKALGHGRKHPAPSEMGNMAVARKSIVAVRPIQAGEPLTSDAVAVMRPGTGRSPIRLWDSLGTPASRAYAPGEVLDP